MRRSSSVSGLLLQLARTALRRVDGRTARGTLFLAGIALTATGVHGLVARSHHCHCSSRAHAHASSRALAHLVVSHGLRARDAQTLGSGLVISPSLAAAPDGYGLAWIDGANAGIPHVHFARLSATGERVGNEVTLTHDDDEHAIPNVVAANGEFGITWTDVVDEGERIEIGFARVGSDGSMRGEPMRVTRGDGLHYGSTLAWNGNQYLLSWSSVSMRGEPGLRVVQFAPDARPGAGEAIERGAVSLGLASATWDGREFAVAYGHWNDRSSQMQARFARVSPQGRPIGTIELGSAPAFLGFFATARASDGVASAWTSLDEEGTSALYFARSRGTRIESAARRIASDDVFPIAPSVAWGTNNSGMVAYTGDANGTPAVYVARIAANGTVTGSPTPVDARLFSFAPSMTWNGREYAIAYVARPTRRLTLRLARFDGEGKRIGEDREIANLGD